MAWVKTPHYNLNTLAKTDTDTFINWRDLVNGTTTSGANKSNMFILDDELWGLNTSIQSISTNLTALDSNAVKKVNNILPVSGNVSLTATEIPTTAPSGQATWTNAQTYLAGLKAEINFLKPKYKTITPIPLAAWTSTADGYTYTYTDPDITATMRVVFDADYAGGKNMASWIVVEGNMAGSRVLHSLKQPKGEITGRILLQEVN